MGEDQDIFSPAEEKYMRMAMELAKTGQGRVAPNPPVGCVIVKGGKVIGSGWHNRLGDLHAEAMALREAGKEARGAVVFTTLSPCTKEGRQPPCAAALLKAGVGEVVVAATDPNPINADGVEWLRQAGIKARSGLLAEEARYLAKGFFKMMQCGRPWLTLKYAMTLDGKIASVSGDSRWVSGEASRELVMDMRSRADAVLVGSGTVEFDNPQLTVRGRVWRERGGGAGHRAPLRVVVDGGCRLPLGMALFKKIAAADPEVGAGEVVVACVGGVNPEGEAALLEAGVRVMALPAGAGGKVAMRALLEGLGRLGVNEVLCEGGAGLAAALLAEGVVDEVAVFVAPKLVGGMGATGPVGGKGAETMSGALGVKVKEWFSVGDDILVKGLVEGSLG